MLIQRNNKPLPVQYSNRRKEKNSQVFSLARTMIGRGTWRQNGMARRAQGRDSPSVSLWGSQSLKVNKSLSRWAETEKTKGWSKKRI